ncbi:MgtC/SapB family protein [Ideonella sp. YS5]|uniref:MgtC/SapB family protein n=1 Tax=Ideonella sp. YS5 TaxID=3453714 RepID=UPI003EEAE3DE
MLDVQLPPAASGLAAALVAGLLIGLERGWSARDRAEGARVAGLRTFSLIGLTGGVLASLPEALGGLPLAGGAVGLSLLLAVSYRESVRAERDLSATSAVAALLTYALGALAASGHALPALAAAVVAAVLLDYKSTLHGWLRLVEQGELRAGLQLLVLSVVVLPLLPDAGYGPDGVLNPYKLWWAVVLLAGLSLAGHAAMRFSGPERGLLWTGVLGGLASSTAATLALARDARRDSALLAPALAGALAASGMMSVRIVVIAAVLRPALALQVAPPLLGAGALLFATAAWHWRRRGRAPAASPPARMAPFDLGTVLGFGALLAGVALAVAFAKSAFGDAGVYAISALSGLVDVDPVVVSLARLHASDADGAGVPATGIALAALASLVTKTALAITAGSGPFARRLAAAYAIAALGAMALYAAR